MHERYQGIVLKVYMPGMHKIALLDSVLGRINAIPATERVSAGALVTYIPEALESHCRIHNLEQIALPPINSHTDIFFMHHVLELCYLSIPLASRESSIINLLLILYKKNQLGTLLYKKLFLAKLFLCLHIQPPGQPSSLSHHLLSFLSESIDTMVNHPLDLNTEQELDKWLHTCIQEHPYRNRFKTIDFYAHMASYERL